MSEGTEPAASPAPEHRSRCARGEAPRGTVLIAVLVMVVLLQVVVVALAVSARRESDLTVQRVSAARSMYAAESAVNMALREVALGTDIDADGGIGSVSNEGNNANNPTLLGARLGAAATSAGGSTSISVRGSDGQAARAVSVIATSSATGAGDGWQGLYAEYYTSSLTNVTALSQISWSGTPTAVAVVPNIEYAAATVARHLGGPVYRFGVRFTGKVYIPAAGTWTFSTNSDDGSDLSINGVQIVNNDGSHGMQVRSGTAVLTEGWHDFQSRWFQGASGASGMIASYSGPTIPSSTVIPARAFRCAPVSVPHLAVNTTLSLQANGTSPPAFIDGFDSSRGAYGGLNVSSAAFVASNSTANQTVRLTGGAVINGSVSVGVGGNPVTGVQRTGGSLITGTESALTRAAALPIIPRPSSIPASSGAMAWSGAVSLSSDRRYTSLQVTGNSTVVTISGHRSLYIDGAVQILNAAQVQLASNSSLTMHVTGSFTVSGTAMVNMNTGAPERVWIIMSGSNQTLSLSGGAQVCARVFNPSGPVQIDGTSSPYASLSGTIAAASFLMTDRGSFHADNRSSTASTANSFVLTSWAESSP